MLEEWNIILPFFIDRIVCKRMGVLNAAQHQYNLLQITNYWGKKCQVLSAVDRSINTVGKTSTHIDEPFYSVMIPFLRTNNGDGTFIKALVKTDPNMKQKVVKCDLYVLWHYINLHNNLNFTPE